MIIILVTNACGYIVIRYCPLWLFSSTSFYWDNDRGSEPIVRAHNSHWSSTLIVVTMHTVDMVGGFKHCLLSPIDKWLVGWQMFFSWRGSLTTNQEYYWWYSMIWPWVSPFCAHRRPNLSNWCASIHFWGMSNWPLSNWGPFPACFRGYSVLVYTVYIMFLDKYSGLAWVYMFTLRQREKSTIYSWFTS